MRVAQERADGLSKAFTGETNWEDLMTAGWEFITSKRTMRPAGTSAEQGGQSSACQMLPQIKSRSRMTRSGQSVLGRLRYAWEANRYYSADNTRRTQQMTSVQILQSIDPIHHTIYSNGCCTLKSGVSQGCCPDSVPPRVIARGCDVAYYSLSDRLRRPPSPPHPMCWAGLCCSRATPVTEGQAISSNSSCWGH